MAHRQKSILAELVDGCRSGDGAAWQELIDLLTPLILSICRASRLSREESLDVFGEVCYRLLNNIDSIKSPDSTFAYVSTITRREIFAVSRRAKLTQQLDKEMIETVTDPDHVGADEAYESARRTETLWKAVSSLSPRDYELVKALFLDVDEPSYEEISRELGLPISSIGPTRARILAKLNRKLKQRKYKI